MRRNDVAIQMDLARKRKIGTPAAEAPGPEAGAAQIRGTGYRIWLLVVLTLVFVLTSIDRVVMFALLEPIKHDLRLSDTEAGFLAGGAFSLFYAVAGLPLGYLADHWSPRKVIGLCIAAWSLATALCGFAATLVFMIFARAFVGVGEAGGAPAGLALISQAFASERRATAISVFYAGSPVGMLIAFAASGRVAEQYGWRAAFFAAALPGLVLAAVVLLGVRDQPPCGAAAGQSSRMRLPQIMHFIASQRSLCHLFAGLFLAQFVSAAMFSFLVSFLVRSHGLSLREAGTYLAIFVPVAAAIGITVGGRAADILGTRSVRRRSTACAMAMVLSALAAAALLAAPSGWMLGASLFAYGVFQAAYLGPTLALCQSLAPPPMRATVAAVCFILGAGVAGALGSVATGAVSDLFAPTLGQESLRWAMRLWSVAYFWAAVHFVRAGHTLGADLARAEAV